MYENFTEYWKAKSSMFEKLGVDENAAHTIWADAVISCVITVVSHKVNS